MDQIDRIEVIRGPGGTLWGANAVNGVINIITKQAKDSKGLTVTTGAATEGSSMLSEAIEYGGSTKHGDFRISALALRDRQSLTDTGAGAGDEMGGGRMNFRYDGGSDKTATRSPPRRRCLQVQYPVQHQHAPTGTFPFSIKYTDDRSFARRQRPGEDPTNRPRTSSSNSFQATYDTDHRGTVVHFYRHRDSTI